jgi:hypothetical protein
MSLPAIGLAGDFTAGLSASSLGAGVEVGYSFTSHFGVRAVGHALTFGYDGSQGDVDYKADLKLRSGGVLLDWFPMAGHFRLTVGGLINGNEVSATGRPINGSYTIGGNTFTAAQVGTLDGKVDFNSAAPYVGVGWVFGSASHRDRRGLGWSFDFGALFEGSPNVTLTSTGGVFSTNPILLDSLKTEEQKYSDDIKVLRTFPVIDFALLYRF